MSAKAIVCPGELHFDQSPNCMVQVQDPNTGEWTCQDTQPLVGVYAWCSTEWSSVDLGSSTPPTVEQSAAYAWLVVGALAAAWGCRLLWRARTGLLGGE